MTKYIVRYGGMRQLGIFPFTGSATLRYGNRVIVATPRGREVGIVRCEADPNVLTQFESESADGNILRLMTEADEAEYLQILQGEQGAFDRCHAIIEKMRIEMKLIRVEHLFGGERLIVYYVADGRIDFRELVKVLTGEFRMRIEMRQVGVRDKTKLLALIGDCGRAVCCHCHLHEMPSVSMKMVKRQKTALDPAKISGLCNRLKCCFRYEDDLYLEQNEDPSMNNVLPQ